MLNDTQVETLAILCDTFVPSIQRTHDPDGFYRRKATDTDTLETIAELLRMSPPEATARFAFLLDLVASPGLGATWGGRDKGIAELSPSERETMLLTWMQSPTPELRGAYAVLSGLVLSVYYGWSDARAANINWTSIGYDGPIAAPPTIERPIRPLTFDRDVTLSCDTVIIGSGAGGGVMAGELASAGHDVIVIEKGPYVAEDGFTQRELPMMRKLYERGGGLRSKNGGIVVLAGSCLGGGTTVNWSGAPATPDYVLDEWANEHGNAQFLSPAFQASIQAVERATNVNTDETHIDRKGQLMCLGASRLGYVVNPYARNVKGCDPKHCGYCSLGCQLGAKQSVVKTYLQSAFDRGARMLVSTEVSRVVIDAGVARGVEAIQRTLDGATYKVTVHAKRVVVAAGSIHTPALLRRSGLTHSQIGENLHIHPAASVMGRYREPVRAWSGAMMPVTCDEFIRIDGNYGFKLVNGPMHPGSFVGIDWRSGEEHKERMLESARLASIGSFVRERDTGRIELDGNGQPIVDYWPSAYDMQHVVRGLQEAARIHFEAGAELLYLPGSRRFDCAEGKQKLEALLADVPNFRLEPYLLRLMTAHQMGTCRMGDDNARHPITPEGRSREVNNLYVADASVFPTCSGANPMASVQHIAHFMAQGIGAEAS